MRNFVAATVAATLIATSALGATDGGMPLPSGKPAGISKAQDGDNTILYVVVIGVVAAGLALVLTTDDSTLVTGTTSTTTATTTTR
jgi:hypothetical protein